MIIEVSVVPKSPSFHVFVKDGKVKVRLRSAPEKGGANAELVRELSDALGGCAVRIISGHTSRRKRLEIAASEAEWGAFLKNQPCV